MMRATAAGLLMLIEGATAHGGLTFPPPRNNFGNQDPRNYTVPRCVRTPTRACSARAGGPCAGGECLWFSEGCYIGCKTCSLAMPAGGNCSDTPCHNYYGEPACSTPELIKPTLPDEFRTWNIGNVSRRGDWTKYHPWRAPVRSFATCAPHARPCSDSAAPRRGARRPRIRVASRVATHGRGGVGVRHPLGRTRAIEAAISPLTPTCGRCGTHLLHMRSAG